MDSDLRTQLKRMIVRVLMLEGVDPEGIGDEDALFGSGLGLDSVDALELAIHVESEFGVKIPEDAEARKAFGSVASLAGWIEDHR